MKRYITLCYFLLAGATNLFAQKTISFPAKDGVTVTADLYETNKDFPFIVLCHQAGYSRGEYIETVKKFASLGYNCLAVDARSGNEVNGVINQTALSARANKKPSGFLDAEQDIIAAIDVAYKAGNKRIILSGSSYSASLALKIAAVNDKVSAVMAFSPGEYFGDDLNLKETIKNLKKPVFVTSAKNEVADVTVLIQNLPAATTQQFIPAGKGAHGSKVLWDKNADTKEYWTAVTAFLYTVK